MELHYSQTLIQKVIRNFEFYYRMELHYSQTMFTVRCNFPSVLLSYGITLLSNPHLLISFVLAVLLSYGITLLSNIYSIYLFVWHVLLSYGITLLSNSDCKIMISGYVLLSYGITLLSNWNQTFSIFPCSFTIVWNYTTLKLW